MPIYEYVCEVCGQRFERRQRFDEPAVTCCPAGHEHVHRLLGRPAVHFKGSGFYVTDNKQAHNAADS